MSTIKNQVNFISFRPVGRLIEVKWRMTIFKKEKDTGRYACFIPALNIHFTSKDKESAANKAKALSRIYFDHFLAHSKNGLKKIVLELHKLGFRAPNDTYTVHKFANNSVIPAKFKLPDGEVPENYINAHQTMVESEMEITA